MVQGDGDLHRNGDYDTDHRGITMIKGDRRWGRGRQDNNDDEIWKQLQ